MITFLYFGHNIQLSPWTVLGTWNSTSQGPPPPLPSPSLVVFITQSMKFFCSQEIGTLEEIYNSSKFLNIQYALRITQYTVRITHYAIYSMHYALRNIQYALRITQYTVCITQYTVRITQYTVYITQYTVRITQYTVCITQFINTNYLRNAIEVI